MLMQRTEGWPAGLCLAALTLTGRADPDESVRAFSGSNRFVGDYLTEEVLSGHSGELREFILAVSILDRVSASLCDHVAGVSNAQVLLDELEHTNLFLVPLDESHSWFRFHYLFAEVARRELELTRSDDLGALHARAADWFLEHGHVDEAVQHLLAAGDSEAPRAWSSNTGCNTWMPAGWRPSSGGSRPWVRLPRALPRQSPPLGWPP